MEVNKKVRNLMKYMSLSKFQELVKDREAW